MKEHSQQLSDIIYESKNELAEAIVDKLFESNPTIAQRYEKYGRDKCLEDTRYHLMYLAEALAVNSTELFSDYIQWVKILLNGLKVSTSDLDDNLKAIRTVLISKSPRSTHDVVQTFIESGLSQLSHHIQSVSYIDANSILYDLANGYLTALLQGDRHLANRMILDAVQTGTSVKDIYLHVFQQSQYEIGRLWQLNKITVAQEHYCTAVTQMVMSQLYPHIFATEKNGYWVVATSVAGELHEIGARMVADFFEMDGWDTHFLGANMPTSSIVQSVIDRKADILVISATMTFHVNLVASLISAIRASKQAQHVKVLVGGYPFNIDTNLWKEVGADGYGRDADAAIKLAKELIMGTNRNE